VDSIGSSHIYALVKCSQWEGLSFEYSPPWIFKPIIEEGLNFLLKTANIPEQSEYLIPLPSGRKVQVSLATHLEIEDIATASITKIVNLVHQGCAQTACITSHQGVVIVKVDKYSFRDSITHTKLLPFADEMISGFGALIATLSPPFSRVDDAPPNGNLSPELMLEILKILLLDYEAGFKTIFNLSCTCKMFYTMCHDYMVYMLKLLCNFALPISPSFFKGLDLTTGRVQLYCVEPFNRIHFSRIEEYRVFVDGANLGLRKLQIRAAH